MKPKQLEVVFIEGRDVFVVLPTGFGKGLCYACLPLVFDKFMKKERGYSRVIVMNLLCLSWGPENEVNRHMIMRACAISTCSLLQTDSNVLLKRPYEHGSRGQFLVLCLYENITITQSTVRLMKC